jgi:branched-subunit amino acid aminotransferase/4-amino-4-deoxychorismate lyase
MGELTPILKADGRIIGDGKAGPITKKMQQLHRDFAYRNGNELPFKNPLEN